MLDARSRLLGKESDNKAPIIPAPSVEEGTPTSDTPSNAPFMAIDVRDEDQNDRKGDSKGDNKGDNKQSTEGKGDYKTQPQTGLPPTPQQIIYNDLFKIYKDAYDYYFEAHKDEERTLKKIKKAANKEAITNTVKRFTALSKDDQESFLNVCFEKRKAKNAEHIEFFERFFNKLSEEQQKQVLDYYISKNKISYYNVLLHGLLAYVGEGFYLNFDYTARVKVTMKIFQMAIGGALSDDIVNVIKGANAVYTLPVGVANMTFSPREEARSFMQASMLDPNKSLMNSFKKYPIQTLLFLVFAFGGAYVEVSEIKDWLEEKGGDPLFYGASVALLYAGIIYYFLYNFNDIVDGIGKLKKLTPLLKSAFASNKELGERFTDAYAFSHQMLAVIDRVFRIGYGGYKAGTQNINDKGAYILGILSGQGAAHMALGTRVVKLQEQYGALTLTKKDKENVDDIMRLSGLIEKGDQPVVDAKAEAQNLSDHAQALLAELERDKEFQKLVGAVLRLEEKNMDSSVEREKLNMIITRAMSDKRYKLLKDEYNAAMRNEGIFGKIKREFGYLLQPSLFLIGLVGLNAYRYAGKIESETPDHLVGSLVTTASAIVTHLIFRNPAKRAAIIATLPEEKNAEEDSNKSKKEPNLGATITGYFSVLADQFSRLVSGVYSAQDMFGSKFDIATQEGRLNQSSLLLVLMFVAYPQIKYQSPKVSGALAHLVSCAFAKKKAAPAAGGAPGGAPISADADGLGLGAGSAGSAGPDESKQSLLTPASRADAAQDIEMGATPSADSKGDSKSSATSASAGAGSASSSRMFNPKMREGYQSLNDAEKDKKSRCAIL